MKMNKSILYEQTNSKNHILSFNKPFLFGNEEVLNKLSNILKLNIQNTS